MLVFLLIVLFCCESFCQKNASCQLGPSQLYNGQTVYSFEVHGDSDVCVIQTCNTNPFPSISRKTQECSEAKHNCSEDLTPKERNISICCQLCSACDFLTCPTNSCCMEDDSNIASCQCHTGYQAHIDSDGLLRCMDTNECTAGTYSCPPNSDCVNAPGTFNCQCRFGYDGPVCNDVNECVAGSNICPPFSQCENSDGFYTCICNEKCPVSTTAYYLTPPNDPADFFEQNPDCSYVDDIVSETSMVVCSGKKQVLTDGITEPSIPPLPSQYVGWERNGDNFTIIVDTNHMRMTQLDLYYYNYPAAGIGLPPLSSIYVSSSKTGATFIGPLAFVYANNQDLSQDDNQMRMASIVIHDNNNELTFSQFVHLRFNYTSSLIWRTQLIEIQAYGGTDSPGLGGEIIFQSESRNVVHLAVEDVVSQVMLSCTVANQGSFSWKWTKSSNASIINSETKQADLTRTSILIVHHLSIEDSDDYMCTAFYSNQSLSFENTATIVLELENDVIKKSTSISDWGSDVNLTCEFTGYDPRDICTIEWEHEGKSISQDYRKYTISQGFGTKGLSQSGGSVPDPSITSTLTISDVEQADVGIYGCRIIGSVGCNQVIGYIQVSKEAINSSTCPSLQTNFISENSDVWLSLFVLATLFLAALIIILTVTVLHKRYPKTFRRIHLRRFFHWSKKTSDCSDISSTHAVLDAE